MYIQLRRAGDALHCCLVLGTSGDGPQTTTMQADAHRRTTCRRATSLETRVRLHSLTLLEGVAETERPRPHPSTPPIRPFTAACGAVRSTRAAAGVRAAAAAGVITTAAGPPRPPRAEGKEHDRFPSPHGRGRGEISACRAAGDIHKGAEPSASVSYAL